MAKLQKVEKRREEKKKEKSYKSFVAKSNADNDADEATVDLKHLEKKESNKKSGSKVKEDKRVVHEEGSTNPVSENGADADKNEDSAIFESRKDEKKDNKRKKKEKIEKHDMSSSLPIPFGTSVLEEASGIRKKRARDGELHVEMDMKHRDSQEMLDSVKKGSKKQKCKDNDKSNIVVEKIESSDNEKKKKKKKQIKEDNSIRIENAENNSKEKMEQPSTTENEEDGERGTSDKKRKKENYKIVKETFARKEGQPNSKKKPNKSRSVCFSGEVEVFPFSSDASVKELDEENLVQGKRFSQEEDDLLKQAVLKYIEENNLGDEGMHMVLNCRRYSQARNCWKKIGASLPWRPYTAVYLRAHVLFERSEERKWDPEDYKILMSHVEKHGPDWKGLSQILGKHRSHIKDTYRRIGLLDRKKGHWTQEEYQTLFDLVNLDLRMKVFEEKKTKYGMLRENISWMAISRKLSTRIDSSCCIKWYNQLSSSFVKAGVWYDADDYRLIDVLQELDACCVEDVDWDNLLEHRSGEVCRKRWEQMIRHLGGKRERTFIEQVEILANRYCPEMLEYRKASTAAPTPTSTSDE